MADVEKIKVVCGLVISLSLQSSFAIENMELLSALTETVQKDAPATETIMLTSRFDLEGS